MQKAIAEFFENIGAIRNERLSNPFFRGVLLALLFLNWKPISILLLSDIDIISRISTAKDHALPIWSQIWISGLSSAIFVFVNPWLSLLIVKVQKIPVKRFRIEKIEMERSLNENKIGLFKTKYALEIQREKVESEWNIEKRTSEAQAITLEEEAKRLKIDNDEKMTELKNQVAFLESRKLQLEAEIGKINERDSKSEKQDEGFNYLKERLDQLQKRFVELNSSRNENYGKSKLVEIKEDIGSLISYSNVSSSMTQDTVQKLIELNKDIHSYLNNGTLASDPDEVNATFIQKYRHLSLRFGKILDEIIASIL